MATTATPDEIVATARQAAAAAQEGTPVWHERSPMVEVGLGLQAILPLVASCTSF